MSLWAILKEDFAVVLQKDPAIASKIELFFNYPGLLAIIHYRFAHALHRRGWKVLARIIMGFTQFITNIDIHPAAIIKRRVFIDHGIGVVIGETAEVHDDVTIYQGVSLGGVSLEKTKRHPTIYEGAVIGAGAKILGNITIGKNAKIGANSVVIRSVPDDSTAVGIPAKVITKGRDKNPYDLGKIPDINRQLFNFLIKRIENIESQLEKEGHHHLLEECEELKHLYAAYLSSLKS
ncbi:serine O-acetyltransferase [Helicobacter monodelphidis]|uniref:serine O-acetyltransferase n=1 Tax=Helicobacter sp. 15-1451 TaxID=2004995 RepID=UPI000DCDF1D2|nr:serine O-acetyltransferase [Helicobacter sp. 15-1451]RAX57335.1 serine O-acetyltransferase [Helicobacter sp. 15-1451]